MLVVGYFPQLLYISRTHNSVIMVGHVQLSSVRAPLLTPTIRCTSLDYRFFFHGSTAPVGQGLLYDVPRSHSDTPHSVGHLCTSDRPVAETSTRPHTTLTTDRHPCGIRTHNSSKRAAVDPRLRPHFIFLFGYL
jgi:hypothetical protein